MKPRENVGAEEESVPAGKRKVEAGAGRHISRAVQGTVCCWKTSRLLSIIIRVWKKEQNRTTPMRFQVEILLTYTSIHNQTGTVFSGLEGAPEYYKLK